MAVVFIDGFDKYHMIGAAVLGGDWNTTIANIVDDGIIGSGSASGFGVGAFGGNSFRCGQGAGLYKSLPGIYSTIIWGLRFNISEGNDVNSFGIKVGDGNTAQITVRPNPSGFIEVYRGGEGGPVFGIQGSTLLATSTASITSHSWHYLEAKITIDHAVGAFDIYLDGVNIISETNQDTQFTSNAYVNSFFFHSVDFNGGTLIDDLYIFDTTTDFNNDIAGDSVVETQYPSSDSVVQMTVGAAAFGEPFPYSGLSHGAALSLRQFTPPSDCIINSIGILPVALNLAAKYKMVIYTDNVGAAGTLMSSGTEIIGTAINVPLIGNLSTPQNLIGGTPYWLGFISDSVVSLATVDDSNHGGFTADNTYNSDAPTTAPVMNNDHGNYCMWGNITTTDKNYVSVSQFPISNPLINYITNSVVGDEDQYNFPALETSPLEVLAVKVSAYCAKSDAGALNVSLMLKSGVVDDAGTNPVQPATASYQYLTSYWNDNPSTGVAWNATSINSATSGIKVVE